MNKLIVINSVWHLQGHSLGNTHKTLAGAGVTGVGVVVTATPDTSSTHSIFLEEVPWGTLFTWGPSVTLGALAALDLGHAAEVCGVWGGGLHVKVSQWGAAHQGVVGGPDQNGLNVGQNGHEGLPWGGGTIQHSKGALLIKNIFSTYPYFSLLNDELTWQNKYCF